MAGDEKKIAGAEGADPGAGADAGDAGKPTFTAEDLGHIVPDGAGRQAEIMELMHSDPDRYASPKVQAELNALIAGKDGKDGAARDVGTKEGEPAASTPAPSAARLAELRKLQTSNPDLYGSDAVQSEMQELLKAQLDGKLPATAPEPARPDVEDLAEDYVPATYAEYGIPDRADGEPRSEVDQRLIDGALKRWHEKGWTQGAVSEALLALDEAEAEAGRLLDERTTVVQVQHEADLRHAFGEAYEQEVAAANTWVRQHLDPIFPGGAKALMSLRLPDGSLVGSVPGFVLWANRMAQMTPGGGAGAGTGSGVTPGLGQPTGIEALAERKRAIMKLMHTDEPAYERAQPELQRIIAAMNGQQQGR